MTLVELVVTIGVIALLLAILMPALGRVRRAGRRVVCLSRLRQMVIAADVYVSNNDGYYPLAGHMDFNDLSSTYEWDFFKKFEQGQLESFKCGYLWEDKGIAEMQQCPSFKGNANSAGDPFTGYNYNASYIGGFTVAVMGTLMGMNSSTVAELRRPSSIAIFGDGEFESGANKYMRSPQAGKLDRDFGNASRYAGTQGYRHLEMTNVAYCDGSVHSVRDLYTETKSKERIERYNEFSPVKIGFLSEDNSAYDLE